MVRRISHKLFNTFEYMFNYRTKQNKIRTKLDLIKIPNLATKDFKKNITICKQTFYYVLFRKRGQPNFGVHMVLWFYSSTIIPPCSTFNIIEKKRIINHVQVSKDKRVISQALNFMQHQFFTLINNIMMTLVLIEHAFSLL